MFAVYLFSFWNNFQENFENFIKNRKIFLSQFYALAKSSGKHLWDKIFILITAWSLILNYAYVTQIQIY